MKKQMISLLAALLVAVVAIAQEMPEAQKNLAQFEGMWVCKNPDIRMGDQQFKGLYTLDCHLVNDNTGILAHEKFQSDDFTMLGENLIGFDPYLKLVHLYSIDNTGTAHDHYGFWIDSKNLFVQYQGVVEGKMYVEQIWMSLPDANTLQVKLHGMHNGELVENINAVFTKE